MKRIAVGILLVFALIGTVLTYSAFASDAKHPPASDERAMKSTVVRYALEQEAVIPARLYGKTLDLARCTSLLKAHAQRLQAVATPSGIQPMDIDWHYLALIRGQLRELHGALPVAWQGKVVYWDVIGGGDTEYTVRAAVQKTLKWATWDPGRDRLMRPGSFTYSSTSADEYTLTLVAGTWKVSSIKHWKFFDVPGGLSDAP